MQRCIVISEEHNILIFGYKMPFPFSFTPNFLPYNTGPGGYNSQGSSFKMAEPEPCSPYTRYLDDSDVWLAIFSLLEVDDILQLRQVCRLFCKLAHQTASLVGPLPIAKSRLCRYSSRQLLFQLLASSSSAQIGLLLIHSPSKLLGCYPHRVEEAKSLLYGSWNYEMAHHGWL
ncbi:hypothetical protein DL96DRAFT_1595703 [Flagelloscypha sp. PMI_526]|nr:hypothetical protein DL96DRAFT_1595703 [Flagelloscypha sp. PMI_526]